MCHMVKVTLRTHWVPDPFGCYGLFTLPDSDSNSDSKPNGYADSCVTLNRVRFRIQSQLPTTRIGSESESVPESVSRNVNETLKCLSPLTQCLKFDGDCDGYGLR